MSLWGVECVEITLDGPNVCYSITALGRAALANYEDEREREIRIKTLLECESAAKAVVDVWRTRGANAVAWAITDLVHAELEKRKVTP